MHTIRRIDRDARAVDLEIVVHGEGPGARWASSARRGDTVDAIGPRGKVTVRADADVHVFACDESGVPATLAMLEALPRDARAVAFFDVADESEVRPDQFDDRVQLVWFTRGDVAPAQSTVLADALRTATLPTGRTHVYLAAEKSVVMGVRDELRVRGVADDDVSPKAYWRADQANAAHGEPAR